MSMGLPKPMCALALLCATLSFSKSLGNEFSPGMHHSFVDDTRRSLADASAQAQWRLPDVRPDGTAQVWKPSKDRPLPVFKVTHYHESGWWGLSNLMWTVGRAISRGCIASEEAMRVRQRLVDDGTLPLGFPVVIIPPLRKELGNGQKASMHQYSDLFDLEHQQKFTMYYKNCYITDMASFKELRDDGLLHHVNGKDTKLKINRLRVSPYRFKGPEMHKVYQGLEMSSRMRKMYYEPCLRKMREVFHDDDPFYTAIHMRVEDDWVPHCRTQERVHKNKHKHKHRFCFGAREIADIALRTPEVSGHRNFLALYAADRFTHDLEARKEAMKVDPMQAWPEDTAVANPILLQCFNATFEGKPMSSTYTERSVISMFLAAEADLFIGNTLSSLQSAVSMLRARPGKERESFIYDAKETDYMFAMKIQDDLEFYEDVPSSLLEPSSQSLIKTRATTEL